MRVQRKIRRFYLQSFTFTRKSRARGYMFRSVLIAALFLQGILSASDGVKAVDWNNYNIPVVGTKEIIYNNFAPHQLLVHDFDGDGRQDIAVITQHFDYPDLTLRIFKTRTKQLAFSVMPVSFHNV